MDEEYELTSNMEIDMLLVDLPMELIQESIRYQINNPLSTNVNYVETIVDKVRVLKEQYDGNEEALFNINKIIQDFFGFLIEEISKRFNISLHLNETEIDELMEIGIVMYDFLIIRYKKNITKFIYKFIVKNKKVLVVEFGKQGKRKDVTTNSLKKKTKNKDDVLILSNLPSIIKYTINLELDATEFIDYACNDENYEGNYLKNLFLSTQMVGNFVQPYLELLEDEGEYVLDEVQTDVRMKLLKKL